MSRQELVDQLATCVGIEPHYYDIHGTRHEISAGTKHLALLALGFDLSTPSAMAQAIAAVDHAAWAPTTAFCSAGRSNECIDIVVPADHATSLWRWRLELESKQTRVGEFSPENLPVSDAKEIGGKRFERRRLTLQEPLPEGYHRLSLEERERQERVLIAVPDACYLPQSMAEGARLWGLSAHLYSLRSEKNWGIGDLGDLKSLLRLAGDNSASFVAVNPFHALFGARPGHASPYSPSSRLFLNPLYIEMADQVSPHTVAALRQAPFVDYAGVAAAKREALTKMWAVFERELRDRPGSLACRAFADFVCDGGEALLRFATFCALDESLSQPVGLSWRNWPARLRDPSTPEVASFAEKHRSLIDFHCYLQFLADRQLADAAQAASDAGMTIGIVRDLAVGVDPDGADAWAGQAAFADKLRCGAPRDAFHPTGQEWGVLPFNPIRLREDYGAFVQVLRANMRHAGGLRIDHIIGIERQFLVPLGEPATKGCYVRYPREQLLGLIALESRRNRCVVIGEDLGTVPEGLRERMHMAQIFGCSIVPFERAEGRRFRAPSEYRRRSLASAGTHDLPTIRGYWTGSDIETRERVGLQNTAASARARAERSEEKGALLAALRQAGALDVDGEPTIEQLRKAMHTFLAAGAAQLFAVQLDDLLDEEAQLNVPGTVENYPNWRRKVSSALEAPKLRNALAELALVAQLSGRV